VKPYRALWLCWAVAFVAIELTAALTTPEAAGTLSVTVWSVWFPTWWSRALLLVFWATVGVHFANRGRRWFSGGAAVALTGLPVALVIAWRERAMLGKVWRALKVVGVKAKAAGAWTLKRGPLVSSLLTGAALVIPGAGPVLKGLAGLVASQSGGAADPALVEAIGVAVNGALLLIGALRKVWALAGPLLALAPESDAPANPGK
jgi:hypothetical protein